MGSKHTELSNLPKDSEVVNGKDEILSAAGLGALNMQSLSLSKGM